MVSNYSIGQVGFDWNQLVLYSSAGHSHLPACPGQVEFYVGQVKYCPKGHVKFDSATRKMFKNVPKIGKNYAQHETHFS